MSNRYQRRKNNNKAKKGITPVIATVILVAVAVVIAGSLAGFSSSLFGTYSSQGAAVTVKSIAVHEDGSAEIELSNSGNANDELLSVSVAPHAAGTLTTTANIVPANGESGTIGVVTLDGGDGFTEGQNITVRMIMKSGLQLTQSVIVSA